ncbi:hypothetical protein ACP70R_046486 [Stipagrostis hirtigluma subsp. patula]
MNLYRDLGKEVPANLQSRLSALQANVTALPTSSSDVGEETDSEDTDGEYMDGLLWRQSDGRDMEEEQIDGEGEGNANIGSNNGGSNEMP